MESSPQFQIHKYSFGFHEKYQTDIVEILNSLNHTAEIIREKIHSLNSSDKIEFIDEIKKGYETEAFSSYYFLKYVKPRPVKPLVSHTLPELEAKISYLDSFPSKLEYLLEKEYQLFLFKNPELKSREESDPNIYLEYYTAGEYPYTDSWIDDKKNALNLAVEELERIRNSLISTSTQCVNGIYISEPDQYLSFPKELISDDKLKFDYSDFRIDGFKSFDDVTIILKKDLASFSQKFGQKEMEALVYNTFNFPENRTDISLLNLSNEGRRFNKTIAKAIRNIVDTAHDNQDIEVKEFTKCLFLNFNCFRKTEQGLEQLKNLQSVLSRVRPPKK